MFSYIQPIIAWYQSNTNYFTITLLMVVESSFIPFPSEIVVPPAAWKAANNELNIYLVVFFSTLGALIGALINYYLAKYLGRSLIYKFADTRFARICLIDRKKVEKAEAYFVKNGNVSTLIGRLIPGIRQLISVPAGLANMKMTSFILYTTLGAGMWNIILAALGYLLQGQENKLKHYYNELSIALLIVGGLFIIYLIYKGFSKKSNA